MSSETFLAWTQALSTAWNLGEKGEREECIAAYRVCDDLTPDLCMAPELAVLRHMEGDGSGLVVSPAPTEDAVVSFGLPDTAVEAPDARGMRRLRFSDDALAANIAFFIEHFDGGYHAANIARQPPTEHFMVLSTGRVGTVSLYRLHHISALGSHVTQQSRLEVTNFGHLDILQITFVTRVKQHAHLGN